VLVGPSAQAQVVPANSGAAQPPPAPQAGTPARHSDSPDRITLNFKDADIDSVVGAFGHLLNRTFMVDPRVRGKITLETPRPVTRSQAYQLLQATLRTQGFAIVEGADFSRVVPEADAKLQGGPVSVGRTPERTGEQVVTQIFRLNYESASNLVPVLRPLITANNTITAYPSNNSLVITDYAANLQRLSRIIATLDSPSTSEVEVVPIRHALAADIAVSVTRLIDDSARAGAGAQVDAGQRVVVLADPRINSVMVRATSLAKMNLAKTLIARLDQPATSPGNINVVYLRNAEAVRLVQVLRGVLTGADAGTGGTAGGLGAGGGFGAGMSTQATGTQAGLQGQQGSTPASAPLSGSTGTGTGGPTTVSAGGAIIAADAATNSLIITAPEPVYRNLRTVIDRLDARRVQVFIESLIVEVAAEKAAEFGIQWQFLNAPDPGSSAVIGGTNLSARGQGTNILDVAANPLGVAPGLNVGVVRGQVPISIGGVTGTILNLGFLGRALETQANANILATPNLLTLDNEEARIIIGQNVPILSGQFTNTGAAGGAVNPFQTFERKDVGTTLRVRPQVSEGGTIRMQIFQEVSNVAQQTLQGFITNRRAIESNVLVDDGQIVVLGGLIEERVEGGENKVPWLGDIPGVGWLFRYDNRKRVKTNLMVFLRPVLLRTADDSHAVTSDRYDYIRQLQGDSRFPSRLLLPDIPPSDLSPMPAAPSQGGTTGSAPDGKSPAMGRTPASLSPDVDAAVKRVREGGPQGGGVIQTAPNEVVVPLRPQGSPPPAPPAGSVTK
jgi:general secretion pathway protein D